MSTQQQKSTHILNASTSLVGFSFVIVSSLRVLGLQNKTSVDDIANIAVMIFIVSTIFSFLSIRSHHEERSILLETIADYIFLAGLVLLFTVAAIFTFNA